MKEMIKEIIREEMMRASMKTYYFMSGLPRSGSTLLSSILNQNPRVYSGPSSPVVSTMLMLENSFSNDELFLAFPKKSQAAKIISSVIENYYSDVEKPVIIDKNRSWVNRLHYIPGYFGIEPKVLCPVRDTEEILTSFITMQRRNPYKGEGKINFIDEMLIKTNTPLNDDNRCEFLASPNGILGQSYFGIQQALMEGKQKSIHFIEYNDLLDNPDNTMKKIYEFLGEEYFAHDFSKIENIHKEKDAEVYGLVDMHDVRSTINRVSVNPKEVLSEEILKRCENTAFWRNLQEIDNDFEEPTFESNVPTKTTEDKFIGG
jgi:sulfotransferase